MSDLSGQLIIHLRRVDKALSVSIQSSRPFAAVHVFTGKPVLDVVRQLPALFSICATAQAQACASACEQALGLAASRGARQRRALLLRAETVKEHLWRLLLDWPKAFAWTPAHEPMASAMRAFFDLRAAQQADQEPFTPGADLASMQPQAQRMQVQRLLDSVAQSVFGRLPGLWLQQIRDHDSLSAWAMSADTIAAALVRALLRTDLAGLGRSEVRVLPDWGTQALSVDLAQALGSAHADAFVAAPSWRGHETTPFARCTQCPLVADLAVKYGNGLLPRLAALLVELAEVSLALSGERQCSSHQCLSQPAAESIPETSGGIGIGHAHAARGLLLHRVELTHGQVADYRVLAPTEWNFHPDGVVASGLAGSGFIGIADDAELLRRAALYVTAVDPCVAYQLSVS